MSQTIKFGDVFRYKEKEYVFLAKTDKVIYAAEILSSDLTTQLLRQHEVQTKKNYDHGIPTKTKLLYCFVVLDTPEYDNRACFHGIPAHDPFSLFIDKLPVSLNKKDLENLKEDITNRPASLELRDLIKNITLS